MVEGTVLERKPTIDYQRIARSYAACRDASEVVVEHLAERLSLRAISSILEMGCGTGDYLAALVQAVEVRGFGFDKSAKMVAEARRKNPGVNLVVGDAEGRFPFDDDSFDACFSVNLIHYLADLTMFFAEAHRVASPGGVVVTVTDSEEDLRRRTMSEHFPETLPIELGRYPAVAEIRRAMEAAGWADVDLTHTERSFPLDRRVFDKYRSKAYSALRLITPRCFQAGLARLKRRMEAGGAVVRELYTYVWGSK